MAILSDAAAKKIRPRGNVLQGTVNRSSTRLSPPMRVTGTVRLYGQGKKAKDT